MKNSDWRKFLLAATLVFVLSGVSVFAQSGSTEETKRKISLKTAPNYPELAKRMNIGGKVKIAIVISPDGHAKSARILGGHPLLVEGCQDAVKEWKFAPGSRLKLLNLSFTLPTRGKGWGASDEG
jgi:TonB family protein